MLYKIIYKDRPSTFRIIPLKILMYTPAKSQNLLPRILRYIMPLIFLNKVTPLI
uniref:Defective in cullin neddylation protein n=1 Tax=Rhizophora mucronata TaxID=61149 RepID=A0A2P2JPH0_RHIMU